MAVQYRSDGSVLEILQGRVKCWLTGNLRSGGAGAEGANGTQVAGLDVDHDLGRVLGGRLVLHAENLDTNGDKFISLRMTVLPVACTGEETRAGTILSESVAATKPYFAQINGVERELQTPPAYAFSDLQFDEDSRSLLGLRRRALSQPQCLLRRTGS